MIAALAAAALLGTPVVVHDAQERSPLASVGARPGTFASEAVYAQHSGAERCAVSGRLIVYVANGSHASYFVPGVRDRMWPDPNDEADGRGLKVTPRVEPLGDWVSWPGHWGGARAGWVPGEMDSPRGPAFQPDDRWSDPEGWARRARPCMRKHCDEVGECDTPETLVASGVTVGALLLIVVGMRRRRSSGDAEHPGA